MEFYQLRTFIIVAEEHSITKAARRLYSTPPSISAHIKALESELNVKLFDRTASGMYLTEKGKLIEEKARKVLSASQDLVYGAAQIQDRLLGTIRFGINAASDYLRIPAIAKRVTEQTPDIRLEIVSSHTAKLTEALRQGSLDLAYIFGNEEDKGLRKRFITTAELVVAAPKSWESEVIDADIEKLASLTWIQSSGYCPFQELVNDFFLSRKLNHKFSICSTDETVRAELVAAGMGLSLLERSEAEKAAEAGRVTIWRGESIHCPLSLAYSESRHGDPLLQAFFSLVTQVWENGAR